MASRLEQPRPDGQLDVQPELANLSVILDEDRLTRVAVDQLQEGLPAGAVESADAQIDGAQAVAVAGCHVETTSPGRALVSDMFTIDGEGQPQTTATARKRARPVVGHRQNLQCPPVAEPRDVRHGLPELRLSARGARPGRPG